MARPKGISTGRERLAQAAGRSFRVGGYGGAGVDTVAREAGLTSGAFYAHFGSKANAFRVALVDGLQSLFAGIERFKAEHGDKWLEPFVTFYLGERLAAELPEACALPTLTADAARADEETRLAYETELARIAGALADGLGGRRAQARAWTLMAILSGGAAMARAVKDEAVRAEIVASVLAAAKAV
ncbi:MAG: TetR/AcrR family transcriptional regulator [Methylobacteriaceae bacterium]|nr:TetR/AcrR family transcriptional regulator [Methylobacteriaceae bacterium]